MIINPYAFGPSYDPDAQAFFTASGLTGTTNLNAINQLVLDLKSYGIWTKMKAIYPFIGGTASLHKWNLKDPQDTNAAFRLVFAGGWTHSSTGAKPNGTNGFADTFLISNGTLNLNSTHLSYYSRTLSSGTEVEMGSSSGPQASIDPGSLIEIRTGTTTYFRINSLGNYISYADADSRAFYISNRTASNLINGWRNNVKVATGSIPSSGLSTKTMTIGALYQGTAQYYTTKECAFSSIGDGLTDIEAANLYTAVQTFNTTLGRNNP